MKLSSAHQKLLALGIIFLLWLISQYVGGGSTQQPPKALPTPRPVQSERLPQSDVKSGRQELVTQLPPEALEALELIKKGGPFSHEQDGIIFQNRERRLPLKRKGYYHEYTVRTPGIRHRGARRMVTGSEGELFYTEDHYRTFTKLAPP